ncbi:FMN-binding protein [Pseudoxanthomonas sp. CAU 1598]|uniref:FMN-binding protein n=2 Tax=Pseudomarimonas arenosa TaxID=2774145 RepID=A0AAW3ZF73_9GAMM|nr:FMN-binding protein [Pseudomarimonas arenosa]
MGAAGLLLLGGQSRAATFLSAAEARELMFPGKAFIPNNVQLSAIERAAIKAASKARVRSKELKAWRSAEGDWFLLDQVIGKHEFIDYAVGFNPRGEVVGVEVLTYRESYGSEVRNPRWRAQFHGRDYREQLELNKQIKNISGATLSCQHITEGINRLAATWAEVLSKRL